MKRAVVIGAGIGGIASAIRLSKQGYEVDVFEANATLGGKISEFHQDGFRFDMGPSLFTLPEEVDDLFEVAGYNSKDFFEYERLPVVTKYFYEDGTILNAWADPKDFAIEVSEKTSISKKEIHSFLRKSRELYEITEDVFLRKSLHKLSTYLNKSTFKSMLKVGKLDAFSSMHTVNAKKFSDDRIVRLFDRYATYNGSNPYKAPATLNIIPHLEHSLGAYFPKGGMYAIASSLGELAKKVGVKFHLNTPVQEIIIGKNRACGVKVNGSTHSADVIVSNMDIVPTYRKLMPSAKHPESTLSQPRSSSALIFYWGMDAIYPELDLHNLFFSESYQQEFKDIFDENTLSEDPTVYVYISSKNHKTDAPEGKENWFVMINVPPHTNQNWTEWQQKAKSRIIRKLEKVLQKPIEPNILFEKTLTPALIESKTSSWQGALYGNSSNNRFAAFLRHPNFSSKIKNLYFVGGSVHPGGGVPLCLLSAKIVADLVRK